MAAAEAALAPDLDDWWSQASRTRLKGPSSLATVPRMHPATAYRRPQRRPSRAARRARRRATLLLVGLAVLVVLAVAAFRTSGSAPIGAAPAAAVVAGPPKADQAIAGSDGLMLYSPVDERVVTAIGYHGTGDDALALDPVGRQANEGLAARIVHRIFGGGGGGVAYYMLGGGQGPSTGALDVGAPVGTDVYAPLNGVVVGLRDYVLNGKRYGSVIDIQPAADPAVVLSVSHVQVDPALTVGSTLVKGSSKIGTVIDFSGVEKLALAQYTRDGGNYVEQVLRSATSAALR